MHAQGLWAIREDSDHLLNISVVLLLCLMFYRGHDMTNASFKEDLTEGGGQMEIHADGEEEGVIESVWSRQRWDMIKKRTERVRRLGVMGIVLWLWLWFF